MPTRAAGIAILCGVLFAATEASAAEKSWLTALWDSTTWDVSTGFDTSTGSYGGPADTTVLSVPLNLRAQFDSVRVELSVPYLDVSGPGTYTGGVVGGGSGLGDVTAGLAWIVLTEDAWPAVELAANVKIPTAADNLGTGELDYTLFANFSRWVTPDVMLFGSAGYQWLTDSSTVELENGALASAGVNYKPAADVSIGVAASYRQEYFDGLGEQVTLSPYVVWSFDTNWRATGYATVGFTEASPDAGGGLRIIYAQ